MASKYQCSQCSEAYAVKDPHRPRVLPCGHTFCTGCVLALANSNSLSCPCCNEVCEVTSADSFPINYLIEDLIKEQIRENIYLPDSDNTDVDACKLSPADVQKLVNFRDIQMHQEQLSQVQQYRSKLSCWKVDLLQTKQELLVLTEQNNTALELLEEENSRVATMVQQGQALALKMTGLAEKLHSPAATTDNAVVEALAKCYLEADELHHNCHTLFPDPTTVITCAKMKDIIWPALVRMRVIPPEVKESPYANLNIIQKTKNLMAQTDSKHLVLQVSDVVSNESLVRRLLQASHSIVYAVLKKESSSKVTYEEGRLYLHAMLSQSPPSASFTFDVRKLMTEVSKNLELGFLDLAWGGISRGRVHIRLLDYENNDAAQNFILLCTGIKGSYRNTKLFSVNTTNEMKVVYGGDYERNNGQGGKLLFMVDRQYSKDTVEAGDIWFPNNVVKTGSQFAINAWVEKESNDVNNRKMIGHVISGLEVVEAATKEQHITNVIIADCGLVLPF